MSEARLNITKTRDITNPTYYVSAVTGEFARYAFDEDRAITFRGRWREHAFALPEGHPMDLEIGTGNGFFFAHRASQHPDRLLLGMELKFKPLIQAIRRALGHGCQNARIVRYHAGFLENLFAADEIDNVFIHHPDPWTKRSQQKHRLLTRQFLHKLHDLQKAGCYVEVKTDSADYFRWVVDEFAASPYVVERYSEDLHRADWAAENFVTYFERMFLAQGEKICYLRAFKAL